MVNGLDVDCVWDRDACLWGGGSLPKGVARCEGRRFTSWGRERGRMGWFSEMR